jgi:hypothetical protein
MNAVKEGKNLVELRELFNDAFEQERKKLEAQGIDMPYELDLTDNDPHLVYLKYTNPEQNGRVDRFYLDFSTDPDSPTPVEQARRKYEDLRKTIELPGLHLLGRGYSDYFPPRWADKALAAIRDIKNGRIKPDTIEKPGHPGVSALDKEGHIAYRGVLISDSMRLSSPFVTELMNTK